MEVLIILWIWFYGVCFVLGRIENQHMKFTFGAYLKIIVYMPKFVFKILKKGLDK